MANEITLTSDGKNWTAKVGERVAHGKSPIAALRALFQAITRTHGI